MIINDLDGCYIVFDTKNRNMELDALFSLLVCKSNPDFPFWKVWMGLNNSSII